MGLYLIAIPLSVYFLFHLRTGIKGFYYALLIGDIFIVIFNQIFISFKFNWQSLVDEAQLRLKIQKDCQTRREKEKMPDIVVKRFTSKNLQKYHQKEEEAVEKEALVNTHDNI